MNHTGPKLSINKFLAMAELNRTLFLVIVVLSMVSTMSLSADDEELVQDDQEITEDSKFSKDEANGIESNYEEAEKSSHYEFEDVTAKGHYDYEESSEIHGDEYEEKWRGVENIIQTILNDFRHVEREEWSMNVSTLQENIPLLKQELVKVSNITQAQLSHDFLKTAFLVELGRDSNSSQITNVLKALTDFVSKNSEKNAELRKESLDFFDLSWKDMVCARPSFRDMIFRLDPNTHDDGGLYAHSLPALTSLKRTTVICRRKTFDEKNIQNIRVNIFNGSELLKYLLRHNYNNSHVFNPHHCAVILFYSSQCYYSIGMVPDYNALAKAFPQIDILAIDTNEFPSISLRFGIASVPTIMLVHNGKLVARYNNTDRSIEMLAEFVTAHTGLKSYGTALSDDDYTNGPLPTQLQPQVDLMLIGSWMFIIVICVIHLIRAASVRKFLHNLVTGQVDNVHVVE